MISGFFGLPGVGKTSFLAKIAHKENRRIHRGKSKYKRVLTNFYCRDCYRLDFKQLGTYDISDSLILIDEITLEADSRDYKNFSHNLKEFFILHRHYGNDVIYFTQQYDGVDKKIRDLTFDLWYVKKIAWFTIATRIYRTIDINENKEIVQGYKFPGLFENILSVIFPWIIRIRKICFRPRYYKYFDSWDKVELPKREFEKW